MTAPTAAQVLVALAERPLQLGSLQQSCGSGAVSHRFVEMLGALCEAGTLVHSKDGYYAISQSEREVQSLSWALCSIASAIHACAKEAT